MKYDVFISSKSEDYSFAEKVYEYLVSQGLNVFLASKELELLGDAEYASAIDQAIDDTKHMIVIGTRLEHIGSKWVKYEWSTFSNDLKSGYRTGNLITILSPSINLKDLPASLRHQQSFHIDSYKGHILTYLAGNSDIEKLLEETRRENNKLKHEILQLKNKLKESEAALLNAESVIADLKHQIVLSKAAADGSHYTMKAPSASDAGQNKSNNTAFYHIELKKVGTHYQKVQKCIVRRSGIRPFEADTLLQSVPCVLFGTFSSDEAHVFLSELRELGATAELIES